MAMSSYITLLDDSKVGSSPNTYLTIKIGRASCRERV